MVIDVTGVLAWIKKCSEIGCGHRSKVQVHDIKRGRWWNPVSSYLAFLFREFCGELWRTLCPKSHLWLKTALTSFSSRNMHQTKTSPTHRKKTYKTSAIICPSVRGGVYSTSQVACASAGRDAVSAMHWVGDKTNNKAGRPITATVQSSSLDRQNGSAVAATSDCAMLHTWHKESSTHSSHNKQMVVSVLV